MKPHVFRSGGGPGDPLGHGCTYPGCGQAYDKEVHDLDTENYRLVLHRFEGSMMLEGHDEGTVGRVHRALSRAINPVGGHPQAATDLISAMQNAGILFRERLYGSCTFQMPDGEVCGAPQSSSLHDVVGTSQAEPFEDLRVPLGEQYSPTEGDVAQELLRVLNIVRKKNAMYGDAWRQQGFMGNLARILSKSQRLKTIAWRSDPPPLSAQEGETVLDTARDLIALAAFFIVNYEQGNGWGSEH